MPPASSYSFPEIRPLPDSVALNPKVNVGPRFLISTDAPMACIVELATDPKLFLEANKGQRRVGRDKLNYFSSFAGLAGVREKEELRTTVLSGAVLATTTFLVESAVWEAFRPQVLPQKGSSGSVLPRLYYRATAGQRFGDKGVEEKVISSTPNQEISQTPFVYVQEGGWIDYYSANKHMPIKEMPSLMVTGNRLVKGRYSKGADSTEPIVLRGVNFSGLQYRGFYAPRPEPGAPQDKSAGTWLAAAGVTEARIKEIASWKSRILRVPLNQDWVLNGLDPKSEEPSAASLAPKTGLAYLQEVDQLLAWAAANEMYVLLCLHTLRKVKTKSGLESFIGYMPDSLSLVFWSLLASRYKDVPAVLYDLCNEPHPADPKRSTDKFLPFYRGPIPTDSKGWKLTWHEWVRDLEKLIHAINPDAVLFVSGLAGPSWSASLGTMPVYKTAGRDENPLPNIVYSSHIYYHQNDDSIGVDDCKGCGTVTDAHRLYWWGDRDKRLRSNSPIFLGEWGIETIAEMEQDKSRDTTSPSGGKLTDAELVKWGEALVAQTRKLQCMTKGDKDQPVWEGLAGWTAWSWTNAPRIVERENPDRDGPISGKPTKYGDLVKKALAEPPCAAPAQSKNTTPKP